MWNSMSPWVIDEFIENDLRVAREIKCRTVGEHQAEFTVDGWSGRHRLG